MLSLYIELTHILISNTYVEFMCITQRLVFVSVSLDTIIIKVHAHACTYGSKVRSLKFAYDLILQNNVMLDISKGCFIRTKAIFAEIGTP